jgi:hypothetical protein
MDLLRNQEEMEQNHMKEMGDRISTMFGWEKGNMVVDKKEMEGYIRTRASWNYRKTLS